MWNLLHFPEGATSRGAVASVEELREVIPIEMNRVLCEGKGRRAKVGRFHFFVVGEDGGLAIGLYLPYIFSLWFQSSMIIVSQDSQHRA